MSIDVIIDEEYETLRSLESPALQKTPPTTDEVAGSPFDIGMRSLLEPFAKSYKDATYDAGKRHENLQKLTEAVAEYGDRQIGVDKESRLGLFYHTAMSNPERYLWEGATTSDVVDNKNEAIASVILDTVSEFAGNTYAAYVQRGLSGEEAVKLADSHLTEILEPILHPDKGSADNLNYISQRFGGFARGGSMGDKAVYANVSDIADKTADSPTPLFRKGYYTPEVFEAEEVSFFHQYFGDAASRSITFGLPALLPFGIGDKYAAYASVGFDASMKETNQWRRNTLLGLGMVTTMAETVGIAKGFGKVAGRFGSKVPWMKGVPRYSNLVTMPTRTFVTHLSDQKSGANRLYFDFGDRDEFQKSQPSALLNSMAFDGLTLTLSMGASGWLTNRTRMNLFKNLFHKSAAAETIARLPLKTFATDVIMDTGIDFLSHNMIANNFDVKFAEGQNMAFDLTGGLFAEGNMEKFLRAAAMRGGARMAMGVMKRGLGRDAKDKLSLDQFANFGSKEWMKMQRKSGNVSLIGQKLHWIGESIYPLGLDTVDKLRTSGMTGVQNMEKLLSEPVDAVTRENRIKMLAAESFLVESQSNYVVDWYIRARRNWFRGAPDEAGLRKYDYLTYEGGSSDLIQRVTRAAYEGNIKIDRYLSGNAGEKAAIKLAEELSAKIKESNFNDDAVLAALSLEREFPMDSSTRDIFVSHLGTSFETKNARKDYNAFMDRIKNVRNIDTDNIKITDEATAIKNDIIKSLNKSGLNKALKKEVRVGETKVETNQELKDALSNALSELDGKRNPNIYDKRDAAAKFVSVSKMMDSYIDAFTKAIEKANINNIENVDFHKLKKLNHEAIKESVEVQANKIMSLYKRVSSNLQAVKDSKVLSKQVEKYIVEAWSQMKALGYQSPESARQALQGMIDMRNNDEGFKQFLETSIKKLEDRFDRQLNNKAIDIDKPDNVISKVVSDWTSFDVQNKMNKGVFSLLAGDATFSTSEKLKNVLKLVNSHNDPKAMLDASIRLTGKMNLSLLENFSDGMIRFGGIDGWRNSYVEQELLRKIFMASMFNNTGDEIRFGDVDGILKHFTVDEKVDFFKNAIYSTVAKMQVLEKAHLGISDQIGFDNLKKSLSESLRINNIADLSSIKTTFKNGYVDIDNFYVKEDVLHDLVVERNLRGTESVLNNLLRNNIIDIFKLSGNKTPLYVKDIPPAKGSIKAGEKYYDSHNISVDILPKLQKDAQKVRVDFKDAAYKISLSAKDADEAVGLTSALIQKVSPDTFSDSDRTMIAQRVVAHNTNMRNVNLSLTDEFRDIMTYYTGIGSLEMKNINGTWFIDVSEKVAEKERFHEMSDSELLKRYSIISLDPIGATASKRYAIIQGNTPKERFDHAVRTISSQIKGSSSFFSDYNMDTIVVRTDNGTEVTYRQAMNNLVDEALNKTSVDLSKDVKKFMVDMANIMKDATEKIEKPATSTQDIIEAQEQKIRDIETPEEFTRGIKETFDNLSDAAILQDFNIKHLVRTYSRIMSGEYVPELKTYITSLDEAYDKITSNDEQEGYNILRKSGSGELKSIADRLEAVDDPELRNLMIGNIKSLEDAYKSLNSITPTSPYEAINSAARRVASALKTVSNIKQKEGAEDSTKSFRALEKNIALVAKIVASYEQSGRTRANNIIESLYNIRMSKEGSRIARQLTFGSLPEDYKQDIKSHIYQKHHTEFIEALDKVISSKDGTTTGSVGKDEITPLKIINNLAAFGESYLVHKHMKHGGIASLGAGKQDDSIYNSIKNKALRDSEIKQYDIAFLAPSKPIDGASYDPLLHYQEIQKMGLSAGTSKAAYGAGASLMKIQSNPIGKTNPLMSFAQMRDFGLDPNRTFFRNIDDFKVMDPLVTKLILQYGEQIDVPGMGSMIIFKNKDIANTLADHIAQGTVKHSEPNNAAKGVNTPNQASLIDNASRYYNNMNMIRSHKDILKKLREVIAGDYENSSDYVREITNVIGIRNKIPGNYVTIAPLTESQLKQRINHYQNQLTSYKNRIRNLYNTVDRGEKERQKINSLTKEIKRLEGEVALDRYTKLNKRFIYIQDKIAEARKFVKKDPAYMDLLRSQRRDVINDIRTEEAKNERLVQTTKKRDASYNKLEDLELAAKTAHQLASRETNISAKDRAQRIAYLKELRAYSSYDFFEDASSVPYKLAGGRTVYINRTGKIGDQVLINNLTALYNLRSKAGTFATGQKELTEQVIDNMNSSIKSDMPIRKDTINEAMKILSSEGKGQMYIATKIGNGRTGYFGFFGRSPYTHTGSLMPILVTGIEANSNRMHLGEYDRAMQDMDYDGDQGSKMSIINAADVKDAYSLLVDDKTHAYISQQVDNKVDPFVEIIRRRNDSEYFRSRIDNKQGMEEADIDMDILSVDFQKTVGLTINALKQGVEFPIASSAFQNRKLLTDKNRESYSSSVFKGIHTATDETHRDMVDISINTDRAFNDKFVVYESAKIKDFNVAGSLRNIEFGKEVTVGPDKKNYTLAIAESKNYKGNKETAILALEKDGVRPGYRIAGYANYNTDDAVPLIAYIDDINSKSTQTADNIHSFMGRITNDFGIDWAETSRLYENANIYITDHESYNKFFQVAGVVTQKDQGLFGYAKVLGKDLPEHVTNMGMKIVAGRYFDASIHFGKERLMLTNSVLGKTLFNESDSRQKLVHENIMNMMNNGFASKLVDDIVYNMKNNSEKNFISFDDYTALLKVNADGRVAMNDVAEAWNRIQSNKNLKQFINQVQTFSLDYNNKRKLSAIPLDVLRSIMIVESLGAVKDKLVSEEFLVSKLGVDPKEYFDKEKNVFKTDDNGIPLITHLLNVYDVSEVIRGVFGSEVLNAQDAAKKYLIATNVEASSSSSNTVDFFSKVSRNIAVNNKQAVITEDRVKELLDQAGVFTREYNGVHDAARSEYLKSIPVVRLETMQDKHLKQIINEFQPSDMKKYSKVGFHSTNKDKELMTSWELVNKLEQRMSKLYEEAHNKVKPNPQSRKVLNEYQALIDGLLPELDEIARAVMLLRGNGASPDVLRHLEMKNEKTFIPMESVEQMKQSGFHGKKLFNQSMKDYANSFSNPTKICI